MRALALSLALATGCIVAEPTIPVPPGYEFCEMQTAYSPRCEDYFYWVNPSWTVNGRWTFGHWEPRPGFHRRIPIRDHRR